MRASVTTIAAFTAGEAAGLSHASRRKSAEQQEVDEGLAQQGLHHCGVSSLSTDRRAVARPQATCIRSSTCANDGCDQRVSRGKRSTSVRSKSSPYVQARARAGPWQARTRSNRRS